MMIAPGEPGSEARSDPIEDIGPPASRMAALYERRDQPRMPPRCGQTPWRDPL